MDRFINEIVHGKESDLDNLGQPKSHFEMYRDVMIQINANTLQIDNFMASIKAGQSVGYGYTIYQYMKQFLIL